MTRYLHKAMKRYLRQQSLPRVESKYVLFWHARKIDADWVAATMNDKVGPHFTVCQRVNPLLGKGWAVVADENIGDLMQAHRVCFSIFGV